MPGGRPEGRGDAGEGEGEDGEVEGEEEGVIAGLGCSGPGSPAFLGLKTALESLNPFMQVTKISDSRSRRMSEELQLRYNPQLVVSVPPIFLPTAMMVSPTVASSKEGIVLKVVASV